MDQTGWISIKYVGDRVNAKDHNYGSDVVWAKNGDIQKVPPSAAEKLLRHPEYEDARNFKEIGKPIVVEDLPVEVEENTAPLIDLEVSTKAEIAVYAQRNFGVVLDSTATKGEMISRVRGFIGGAPRHASVRK